MRDKRKHIDKVYKDFPVTNKIPKKGDYWMAYFPFQELGNFGKLRPIYIEEINEKNETIIARMITTNSKRGIKIEDKKHFVKDSYLTNNKAIITYDKLYRRIKSFQDKT